MYREIRNHTPADKLFQQKLFCQRDILLKGEFVLQGNVKAVGQLGFGVFFRFLNSVP